jgi:bidirectional [NiFe] hydrogenase diaphorase subunit
MSEVSFTIDGKQVKAEEGTTVLETAQRAGIRIPTLCHHEKLKPYTACRLCMVEIERRGRVGMDTSCSYPVENGINVKTRSENIDKIRRTLIELMLARAPDAPEIQTMALEYGANKNRFEKEASFCVLCGLCVRYCAEVKKANAVTFVDRGTKREIQFVPEVAAKECWGCRECFSLCPTEALQANFVLTEALACTKAESGK